MKPCLLALAAGLPAFAAPGAPITFNTALPVARGEFIARAQAISNQSGEDPSGAYRDRTARTLVGVLGYGATPRLALFGVLPYRDSELSLDSAGQRVSRKAEGWGDLRLFGRYTLLQRDRPGNNFRLAPFFGLETPTGRDHADDALGEVPPPVQPGSGSWDPFAGLVATYQTFAYQWDAQISYQNNNAANGFEAGDLGRLDASLQYRLLPRRMGSGVPDFLYGVIEANLIHQRRNKVGGVTDPDSGGTRLFLAPGLQYVTRRWILEAAVQLPVVQDLNGTALENESITRVSFRYNF